MKSPDSLPRSSDFADPIGSASDAGRQSNRLQKPDLGQTLSRAKAACIVFVFCAMAAIAASAQEQTFTTLLSFNGTDGQEPLYGPLIQATDGNFYGTTYTGGAHTFGTVFKITPEGTLTTLYSFCAQANCTDGAYPYGGLIQATNGDFYGTTYAYGAGYGTVFKITSKGVLTTLHSFEFTDGSNPYAGLVQGTDGNFYGTTNHGGAYGLYGTVFKMTPAGVLTTLHSFCSQPQLTCPDGAYPSGALIQGTDGNFYGTTPSGGSVNGYGTVFKISSGGALTTLHAFCYPSDGGWCTDGSSPLGSLVQANNGNLYGMTSSGGAIGTYVSAGTVFEITPLGGLTTLYSFCSQPNCADGASPRAAGLVQAADGNFYGTTVAGGTSNLCRVSFGGCGTVFEITPGGALTTLYSFCTQSECADGYYPSAGLLLATNGIFYGTTAYGGANGEGTIFGVNTGLSPFVQTQTTSGKVGGQGRRPRKPSNGRQRRQLQRLGSYVQSSLGL
jgi:uncharacterized repeat protein (TIGR03803 family)